MYLIKKIKINDFSRLNWINNYYSKRNLLLIVNNKYVKGRNDPSLPIFKQFLDTVKLFKPWIY